MARCAILAHYSSSSCMEDDIEYSREIAVQFGFSISKIFLMVLL